MPGSGILGAIGDVVAPASQRRVQADVEIGDESAELWKKFNFEMSRYGGDQIYGKDIQVNFIKWNPAIKKESDKNSIIDGINNDLIDIIASDHAPHTLDEKTNSYSVSDLMQCISLC